MQGYTPEVNGVPVCFACRQGIYEPYLRAFKLNWHPYHLKCNLCSQDFTNNRKLNEGADNFAYCEPCYMKAFAPKCGRCGEVITGQMVKAGIKTFHPEHFSCTTCDAPFGGVFFTGDDGSPYCEKHYYIAQGLWCHGCDGAIIAGKMLKVGKKSYHPNHFSCHRCKQQLTGREYFEHEDNPYCSECYKVCFG